MRSRICFMSRFQPLSCTTCGSGSKVAFFFRLPQNGGNPSGASFEDRAKRFFGSDSKMVLAVPHVSLFLKFDLCPEIFSDIQILKLHYLIIKNPKFKPKLSRLF